MSCSPVCWILHSRTGIISWITFRYVLKGHEESCRAEPGPGTGTDQGAGKDPSPAAGSWLALLTAQPHIAQYFGRILAPVLLWGLSSPALLCFGSLSSPSIPSNCPMAPCSASTTVPHFAQFTASATFPKIQFFPLPLEHCILFNPSPVTPAPAVLQLDSKNNLFIHTAHAIIS